MPRDDLAGRRHIRTVLLATALATFAALLAPSSVEAHRTPRLPAVQYLDVAYAPADPAGSAGTCWTSTCRAGAPPRDCRCWCDELVPHGQSAVLFDTIEDRCLDATFHSIPGVGHSTGFIFDTSQATEQTVF